MVRCLAALGQQSLGKNEFEIIVVNDGPGEASADIMKQLAENKCHYKYLTLDEKKGPAAARNLGWRSSSAELIAFTDDDCLPDKDWLKALVNSYQDDMMIAFTGSIIVPISERPTDFARNTAHLEKAEFVTANCCITRQALIAIDGFDERFSMAWREDSDLEFKLLSFGIPIKRVEAAQVVHPVRQAKWGISIKEQHKGIFNALLYKKFPALYRSKIQPSPAWDYYIIVFSSFVFIVGVIKMESGIIIPSLLIWSLLMIKFIRRRLIGASHSFAHILEMIVTSMVIPFVSIYWQLYGAIKYRVLFF